MRLSAKLSKTNHKRFSVDVPNDLQDGDSEILRMADLPGVHMVVPTGSALIVAAKSAEHRRRAVEEVLKALSHWRLRRRLLSHAGQQRARLLDLPPQGC